MDLDKAKILVFTVDCWNNRVGSDTMSSLLSWCKKSNLANIYIRSDYPTYKDCDNYFQIRESDVIKSIIIRNVTVGRRVVAKNGCEDDTTIHEKEFYSKFRRRRRWLLLYAREILWKLGRWKSKELRSFLNEFQPDIIFFPYEGYIHFNRLVRYSIKYTHAHAIGYFWDDNFTYKQKPHNVGFLLYRLFQRNDIKKTLILSEANFAIAPKTKLEADEVFGTSCVLLTKPIRSSENAFDERIVHSPINILYTGNLGIGRFYTLKLLSDAIAVVNKKNTLVTLDVYTNTVLSEEEKMSLGFHTVVHPPVRQEVVSALQKEADILLFLEDMVGKESKTARLSFSTKITDYFAAGKCILALTADEIAPIEYLKENNAAVIATSPEQITVRLQELVDNHDIISIFARNAWMCGQQNHNYSVIINRLRAEMARILSDEKEN